GRRPGRRLRPGPTGRRRPLAPRACRAGAGRILLGDEVERLGEDVLPEQRDDGREARVKVLLHQAQALVDDPNPLRAEHVVLGLLETLVLAGALENHVDEVGEAILGSIDVVAHTTQGREDDAEYLDQVRRVRGVPVLRVQLEQVSAHLLYRRPVAAVGAPRHPAAVRRIPRDDELQVADLYAEAQAFGLRVGNLVSEVGPEPRGRAESGLPDVELVGLEER